MRKDDGDNMVAGGPHVRYMTDMTCSSIIHLSVLHRLSLRIKCGVDVINNVIENVVTNIC